MGHGSFNKLVMQRILEDGYADTREGYNLEYCATRRRRSLRRHAPRRGGIGGMINPREISTAALRIFISTVFLLILVGAAQAQTTSLVLGYSGSGISTDLRRVMDLEKIWEKHGLNIKSVYFNSGSVLTQAMIGGNIAALGFRRA